MAIWWAEIRRLRLETRAWVGKWTASLVSIEKGLPLLKVLKLLWGKAGLLWHYLVHILPYARALLWETGWLWLQRLLSELWLLETLLI